MFPKHYSLKNDHDDHFEVHDKRDGKSFKIAKKEMHPANQLKILRSLPKFAEGGDVGMDTGFTAKDKPYDDSTDRPWYDNYIGSNPDQPTQDSTKTGINMDTWADKPQPSQTVASNEPIPQLQPLDASSPAPVPGGQPQAAPQPQAMPQGKSVNDMQNASMSGFPTVGSLNKQQQQYEGAVNAGAKGQMAQNQQIAALYEPKIKAQELAVKSLQDNLDRYQNSADNLAKDIAEQKIDPKAYWNNMSEHGKFMTGMGVMMSSLGQGMMSHPVANMAYESLQKNIDRDIESQKMELGKKQTLLSDNFKQQGNMIAAENATRAQYESMFQGKLAQLVAKTNNPMVASEAAQKIAESRLRMMQFLQPVAQNQMSMEIRNQLKQGNVQGQDPAEFVPYLGIPEARQKEVYEEIKNHENLAVNGPKMMEAFDKAAKEQTILKTGAGLLRTSPSLMHLHQLMLPNFKSIDGTVRQAAMEETFKNVTPAAGDSPYKTQQMKKALQDWINSEMAAPTAKGYGLDLNKFHGTQQTTGASSMEGQTASDAKGNRIVMRNGKWIPSR